MAETMLVNVVNEEESRIAIISGQRLKELSVETAAHEQIEGNIYKAKIVKILPALDAVFVDYGGGKNGFLSFPDIHPRYFDGGRGAEGLKRNQELLVQVRKGEIGQKGAALTTYVSIPGRYIVLMPLVNKKGVSRKIQDEEARRELKDLLRDSGLPDEMGYIVRTAGLEQNKQDLSRDVGYLLRLWKKIQSTAEKSKAPCLLYQESDIVIRTIRDYFTPSIQEVWVDNPETCEQVRAFFRTVMPWYQKRLKLYEDRVPLFSKFDVEAQLASIYEKTVPLPSGGSIVIEQTEALVSVDVNSGKTMKGKDIEETAFIANCEAAEEAARQLRLRDLGGLVVLDFIDMRSSTKRNEVRKVLQKALKEDKARTDVGTISKFGLLELSRQRIKPAGLATATACPACRGTGKVRPVENFALYVLRLVQTALARRAQATPEQVLVGVPAEAAAILVNRKRRALSDLEAEFSTAIAVFAEPTLQANQFFIDYRRGGSSKVETNLPDDFPRSLLKAPAGLALVAVRAARPSAYAQALELDDEPVPEVPEEPADDNGEAPPPKAPGEAAPAGGEERTGKKRKRRRRKKKKGGGEAGQPAEGAAAAVDAEADSDEPEEPDESGERDDAEGSEPEALPSTPASGGQATGEEKRLSPSAKRRARRRRKKALPPGAPAELSEAEGEAPAPAPEPAAESEPEPAPDAPDAPDAPQPETPAGAAEAKPKKSRRRGGVRRRPAAEADTATASEAAAAPPAEPPPAPAADAPPPKTARKRAPRPRRKKSAAPEE